MLLCGKGRSELEQAGGSPPHAQKTSASCFPNNNAEDSEMETRSLDAKSLRATDPLTSVGRKHIAEGAGSESNPSWFPLPKTKKPAILLQLQLKKIQGWSRKKFEPTVESRLSH
jgi:hypothetical protein